MRRLLRAAPALLALAACGHGMPPPATVPESPPPQNLDQRLVDLAQEVPEIDLPNRPAAELRGLLENLQAERARLLLRFTEQHPAVVLVNRKIERVQARLQTIEGK